MSTIPDLPIQTLGESVIESRPDLSSARNPEARYFRDDSDRACASIYDRHFRDQIGRYALHAAMAGMASVMVRNENNHYVHVPSGWRPVASGEWT